MLRRRIPAIVSDIDGVLVKGKHAIPCASGVLQNIMRRKFVHKDDPSQKFSLPFVCLTNGGGYVEQIKADQLNGIFQNKYFDDRNVILNFTPLRGVLKNYVHKTVLICGTGQQNVIAESCDLRRYITIKEYEDLRWKKNTQKLKERFRDKNNKSRFQDKQISLQKINEQIEAIFILHDPVDWEISSKTILDLLNIKHLPIYVVNNDILYKDQFILPRIAFGPFTYVLKELYRRRNQKELEINYYGKPTKNTFSYAENFCIQEFNNQISNFYMIGDNPQSDIRGANLAGWNSILVRTGVFQGNENDPIDPAKYVVEDIEEAFKLICEQEKLKVID